MNPFNGLLEEDLIFLNMKFDSYETLLTMLGNEMTKKGYVVEGYTNALLEREKLYPTGLATNYGGVAIPHADPSYILEEKISIGILTDGVAFKNMGATDEEVQVSVVFLLVLKNASKHLEVLQTVTTLFQNESFMQNIRRAKTNDEVLQLF